MSTFQPLQRQRRSAPATSSPTTARSNQLATPVYHTPVTSPFSSGAPVGGNNAASSSVQPDWQAILEHAARFGHSLANISVGDRSTPLDHTPGKEQLRQRILAARGQGHPLVENVQHILERRLGADLSGVRVHTDADADHMAHSVNAAAFTTGPDIFFRSGVYHPDSSEGLRMLAHEAVHTVQQAKGPVSGIPHAGGVSISDPGDRFERAAEAHAARIAAGPALQSEVSEGSGGHTLLGPVQIQRHMYKGGWHGWRRDHKHQNEAEAKEAERKYDLSLSRQKARGPAGPPQLVPKEGLPTPSKTTPTQSPQPVNAPSQAAQPHQIVQRPVSTQQLAPLPNLNTEIIRYILHFLPEEDLLTWRLVSKFYRRKAESLLMRLFLAVTGYSSLHYTSLQGVLQYEIAKVVGNLRIAVDKLDLQQLELILQAILKTNPGLRKAIQINVGSDLYGRQGSYPNLMMTPGPEGKGKMHNKFLVSGKTVMTGSPNITMSGLHNNIELLIKIVNPLVAGMFRQYFNLIRQGATMKTKQGQVFSNALASFNEIEATKLRLALAPFINISKFIEAELQGKDTIIVRMFLISLRYGTGVGNGIVESLGRLAKENGVDITVVIDEENYNDPEQPYVKAAAEHLLSKNVKIILQQTIKKNIMHDKLILAANKTSGGRFKDQIVMAGSSGFTTSVMKDKNYENFVSIDDEALFNYFYQHHRVSLTSKNVVSKRLEPKGKDLGGE